MALAPAGYFLQRRLFSKAGSGVLESIVVSYFLFTVCLTVIAFFASLSSWFLADYAGLSIAVILFDRPTRGFLLKIHWPHLIIGLIFSSVLASFAVKLPDEASYYLQTIYALQEDGWIKGIGNLEPRFAMGSSFHVFSAVGNVFSDAPLKLNALLIAALVYTGFERLAQGQITNGIYWFIITILGFPVYFLLIPSQSPDVLGIIVTSLLVEKLFLDKTKNHGFISLLLGTSILLKPNAAISCTVLLLFTLTANGGWRHILRYSYLIILAGLLLIVKNIVLSGYPFYPVSIISVPVDWAIPLDAAHHATGLLQEGNVILLKKLNLTITFTVILILGMLYFLVRRRLQRISGKGIFLTAGLLISTIWVFTIFNFRLASHFLIPFVAFFLSGVIYFIKPVVLKKVMSTGMLIVTMAICLAPDINLGRWQSTFYDKFDSFELSNIVYPKKPQYPDGYCGEAKFPCVTFELYPSYQTQYNPTGQYYYLKKVD